MTGPKRFTVTGAPCSSGMEEEPLRELSRKIRKHHEDHGVIDINNLRSLLMLGFDVDFNWDFYHLRYTENQFLYFSLSDTEIYYENTHDEDAPIVNVILVFEDASLSTSLQLRIGVRDFNELMVPVTMPSERVVVVGNPPSD